MSCVQSADDFSERSLRLAEMSRDHRNLEEEEEDGRSSLEANKGEEPLPLLASSFKLIFLCKTVFLKHLIILCLFVFAVNGEAEQVDFIDSSVTEEEEEEIRIDLPMPPLTAPPLVSVIYTLIGSNIAQHFVLDIILGQGVIECVNDFSGAEGGIFPTPSTRFNNTQVRTY